MSPEQIKDAVEHFTDLLNKQEKLQNQLIKLSGRDSDQEIIVMQQLHSLEQTIEFIDYAIYDGEFLSARESCAVEYRTRGQSMEIIQNVFGLKSQQSVRNILEKAYQKMADAFNQDSVA